MRPARQEMTGPDQSFQNYKSKKTLDTKFLCQFDDNSDLEMVNSMLLLLA